MVTCVRIQHQHERDGKRSAATLAEVHTIYAAMKQFPCASDVIVQACSTIAMLVQPHAGNAARLLVDSGVLDHIATAMMQNPQDGEVQMHGCMALSMIISNHQVAMFRLMVVLQGGLRLVMRAILDHHATSRSNLTLVVFGFAVIVELLRHPHYVSVAACVDRVMGTECVDVALTVLAAHPREYRAQFSGLISLTYLTDHCNVATIVKIVSKRNINLVLTAMAAHNVKDSSDVQEWALKLLVNLLRFGKPPEVLGDAMDRYDPLVINQADGVACPPGYLATLAAGGRTMKLIQVARSTHPGNKSIQEVGARLLAYLNALPSVV